MKAQMFKADEKMLKKFWLLELEKGKKITKKDLDKIRNSYQYRIMVASGVI